MADHKHNLKIDRDLENSSNNWMKDEFLYIREIYGNDGLFLFAACTHEGCKHYVRVKKSLFYPTLIGKVDETTAQVASV